MMKDSPKKHQFDEFSLGLNIKLSKEKIKNLVDDDNYKNNFFLLNHTKLFASN